MPKWARRILSIHFNDACFIHDRDHNNGVCTYQADRRFYENMQDVAGLNPFLRAQALLYYAAVRVYSRYKS